MRSLLLSVTAAEHRGAMTGAVSGKTPHLVPVLTMGARKNSEQSGMPTTFIAKGQLLKWSPGHVAMGT